MTYTEVVMQDGKKISTYCSASKCLQLLMEGMLLDRDMVVGVDMEYFHAKDDPVPGTKIALLSLCTSRSCALIDSRTLGKFSSLLRHLSAFLNSKDIVFGCAPKKNDLAKLKEEYGLEIRNAVDVIELVASVYQKPMLSFSGVRELASYTRVLQVEPRSTEESLFDWTPDCVLRGWLPREKVECATVDAYAAYKLTKYLLKK